MTFAAQLERFGERIAFAHEDGARISYGELARRADAFAATLGPHRRLLMIEAANEIEPLIAYLGALRNGHPVLMSSGGGHNARIADTYRPDAIFEKTGAGWPTRLLPHDPEPMHPDLAVLLTTSGSTGAVKLARLSHRAVEANAASIVEFLDVSPDDRAITTLPIHYSYGLSVVTSHLSVGAQILLTDRSVMDSGFWDFFRAEEATSLAGVPYTYELFDRIGLSGLALPSLRVMTQAGGRLPPEVAERYGRWASEHGVRFFVMYGQTEATARMAYMPPDPLLESPGSIGRAIPGGAFRLIDEEGFEVVDAGVEGELVYTGPNVMMGYAEDRQDLIRGQDLAELMTGDLATFDDEGFYRITGRKSRFSKLFGLRISLDELEAAARRRDVQAAAAGDDKLLALAVVGGRVPEGLERALAAEIGLPSSALKVVAVDALPRLPSGKTDYMAILRAARADMPGRRAGERGVQAAYARAFAEVDVSPEDSFVSLGGDSLDYVGLSLDLETELGTLPDEWADMTIDELQAMADQATQPGRGLWAPRGIEAEVILRAMAIIGVTVKHASTLSVGGGAEVLLLLSGFNMARYQRTRLVGGQGWSILWALIKRVILPYYLLLVVYSIWKGEYDPASLLLVSNFIGRFGSLLDPYWFLELLLQCTILMVLLFLSPPVRRLADKDPWLFGLSLLTAAIAIRLIAFAIFHHSYLQNRTPDALLYFLALGWCLQQAKTLKRKLLMSGVVTVILALKLLGLPDLWYAFPYPANLSHALWLLVAAGLILWKPRLTLPRWAQASLGVVAASSFYIYLTHGVPVHVMFYEEKITNLLLILPVCLAVGILARFVAQKVSVAFARRAVKVPA